MRRLDIIPGLILDEELYGAAAAGLAAHARGHVVSWEEIADPARWWRVPSPDDDDQGVPLPYKDEFLVTQTPHLTIKVNVWHRPDLRCGETSRPHTHPWEVMEAYPVLGGYEDDHWHRTAAGQLVEVGSALNVPGRVNRIHARDYHEVTAIHEPGRTVSVLVCGRWIHDEERQGVWGHLDLHTGDHVPVQRDPVEQARFRARLRAINPQHN